MKLSLRRRLVAVSLLAAAACVGALLTIGYLARSGLRLRVERAEERVSREIERLQERAPRDAAPPHRGVGMVVSGYLDATGRPLGFDAAPPPLRALRDEAFVACVRAQRLVVRTSNGTPPWRERRHRGDDGDDEGRGTLVLAVAPAAPFGYAWAVTRVVSAQGSVVWRSGALVMALLTLALVVVAVHTLVALRRGAAALDDTLRALSRDLSAPVLEAPVEELAVVADGIAALASALLRAQEERERLMQALHARERLASLGRVVAGVAHEVRNPMASIKLRVDLARQTVLSPRADLGGVAADLAEVADEVSRLDRLVADLLVVSGRRAGPRREVELGALATRRAEAVNPIAAPRGVRIEVVGAATLRADVDGVTRAIDNLLRNAAEASPEGGSVRVCVTDGGARVSLRVMDEGLGVAPDRVQELFEPFFTTKSEGTGLGLALSRAVAEAHGGTLRYLRDGATTVFELTLPKDEAETHGDGAGGRG